MFDWKTASVEDLAAHMLTLHRSNVSMQVSYYKLKGNKEMLTKIENARKLCKILRLRAKAQSLEDQQTYQLGDTDDKTCNTKEDA